MTVALLFPGQGAESPRMGLDLAARSEAAAALLALAGEAARVDARRVLERGGPEFATTEVIQPLLVAVSLAFHRALCDRGVRAGWVAGLSLGEVPAAAAAGAISGEAAVRLSASRGRLMGEAARAHPGGMLALNGVGEAVVKEAIEAGGRSGSVQLAARHAPDLWVLSGDRAALEAVAARFPVTRLRVAGAWHSQAMAGAMAQWRKELDALCWGPLCARWCCNRTGEEVADPSRLPELLCGQLVRPVDWARSISTLAAAGVTDYILCGPGRVLKDLVRRNAGSAVRVHPVEAVEDLDRTAEALRA